MNQNPASPRRTFPRVRRGFVVGRPLLADRYLLEEVLVPFVIGLQVILVPLLADSLYYLMRMVLVHHVEWRTVGRLLLFLTPQMLATAFPLATILAVSLGVGRLAREGEWTALRLSGWSLWRLVVPFVVFGALASAGQWVIGEYLAPRANAEFGRLVTRISLSRPAAALPPKTWTSPLGSGWSLYVNAVDETSGELQGLVMFTNLDSDYPTLLAARTARYTEGRLELAGVVRHVWRPDGTIEREGASQRALFPVEALVDATFADLPRMPDTRSAADLRLSLEAEGYEARDTRIDLHRRYAAPLSCLVLALLCVPLNAAGGRRSGFLGLLIAAVLVVVYFLTQQLFVSIARNGNLDPLPALGPWLQNVLFVAAALVLLWRQRR